MNDLKSNMAKGHIENYYLKNKRNLIYIALEEVEDVDFFWSSREIKKFDRLWNENISLTDIAKRMHRSEIGVFLLAFDRIGRKLIKPRKNWRIW